MLAFGVIRVLSLCLVLLLLAFFLTGVEGENVHEQRLPADIRQSRIVVIGDIHGDPKKFCNVLTRVGVASCNVEEDGQIKARLLPSGDKVPTTLVQLGDLVDRGSDDREALNIAFDLLEEARNNTKLGNVVMLLGNHELLNLQKQYYYVHSDGLGGFSNRKLRDMAFDIHGPYGKFIIENFKTMHIHQRTVFVHAGITSDFLREYDGEEHFNDEVRKALREKNFRSKLLGSSGPLWTRTAVYRGMTNDCDDLQKVLRILDVDRMVVGHTPQRNGHIGVFCNGSLFAADVGLSRWMYNQFAVLEIEIQQKGNTEDDSQGSIVTLWEVGEGERTKIWPVKAEAGLDAEDLADL